MNYRLSAAAILLLLALVGPRAQAAFSVPLTIQEAIYPGSVPGVTRTADPVTVGIPLPDDSATGVTDVSQLTLTGATAGQFRVLGRWPSGRIKWVLVDTQASVSASGTATGIALTTGGSGNFGGSNLATDNGATITVATGTGTFIIRKANFNGFHQVVVGGTTIVAAGASTGLVITGPAPGNTTCGTCTTVYSSANDASSTAVIEENGPVRTVIRATGEHKDSSGNGYMKFTVRMHFYKGLSRVKAVTTLRNADNGASNSFAVAYKGLTAYEWRTTANIAGTRTYDIAKEGGLVENGTLSGSDDVYLYQGQSLLMKEDDWGGTDSVAYTADSGWDLRKNSASLDTGSNAAAQAPGGWADIRNSAGVGLSIGVYQMAAYWPKSLEFASGGSEARIGIWPRQNTRTFHQAWPQWSTHDLYFNFHAAALASPANEFLKFQHYLLARASYTHYNSTRVFGVYPMVAPAAEQAFYEGVKANAVPSMASYTSWPYQDKGTTDIANWRLPIWRFKAWGSGGGGNQMELHWSYFFNWITRGMTGRYLDSMHFYRLLTDDTFPHSDEFAWRDQTGLSAQGYPSRTSANSTQAFRNWIDTNHAHWYGLPDYYFLTGDELAKEQLLDGVLDYHTTPGTYQAVGLLATTRSVGAYLIGAARFATFLNAIGQSTEATTVLNQATGIYNAQVKRELCPNSDATHTGCVPNLNYTQYHETSTPGVSRLRGHWWAYGVVGEWCDINDARFRSGGGFSPAIGIQGILELRDAKGPGWADYEQARDLAYGVARAGLGESYYAAGNGRWDQDGFRPQVLLDLESATGGGGAGCPPDDDDYEVLARATVWQYFYARYLVEGTTSAWENEFKIAARKLIGALGVVWHEHGSYQLTQLIDILNNPSAPDLSTVPLTGFTDNGGGSYTIRWTVPTGTQNYRIKWSPKTIVEWLNFNQHNYTFGINPTDNRPWFSATNVTPPAPATPGTTQSLTVSTATSGLTAASFSVKAYVGGSGGTTIPPGTAANLLLVSGNNQTSTVGTVLGTPLTVKVTDDGGNAVAGTPVSFAVAAGGGSLSSTQVATNTSGLASTTLTLGAAAGTNTVQATSGTLAGSPVLFTAIAVSSSTESPMTITPNQWVNVTPTYQGAPNGGQLTPMTYNNIGVYDPGSRRTISFERWYDPIRSSSIYANALLAYDPGANVATALKVSNWTEGKTELPANTTDPTPIDRHPLGGLALDPSSGAVYLVNGANQAGRAYYPDHPNDTWKFSLGSGLWSKLADPIANPSIVHPPTDVSSYSGMVYDQPTGKLAYFVTQFPNGTRTWLFDPGLNQWSTVTSDATAANVYISGAGIAYDSRRNQALAYAGGTHSDSGDSRKLWAYSVSQNKWTALADAPIAATAPEFAYDSVHDVFLALVGQKTLIYNPRTNAWTYLAATINRGLNQNRQNVTYNPAQDVFVFQGGTPDTPVWSLFRYTDAASPALTTPIAPSNLRIIK